MKMQRFIEGMTEALDKLTAELGMWRMNAHRLELNSYKHFWGGSFNIKVEFRENEEYKIMEEEE